VTDESEMPRIADPRAKITLLRAAEEVFAERGLAAAHVEEIAKRAGLSKGAFYLHFESKETALKQIVESFLARFQTFFAPPAEYPDLPEDADDLIDFAIERDAQIFEYLWQNRAILRILPTCQGAYDYLTEAFKAEIDARNREWIGHFMKCGLWRPDVDAELASAIMSGAYNELTVRMVKNESRPPFEEWVRFALDTFVRAFGSRELIDALDRRNRRVSVGIKKGSRSMERERL
jgi:AcrR family transcriptional regulator